MPRYFVVDPERFKAAILAEHNVAEPASAIEATPETVSLPVRSLVIRAGAISEFLVLDQGVSETDLPPTVVRASSAPQSVVENPTQ